MPSALTASGIARALVCPAAYALPAVSTPAGIGAARGTLVHAYYEAVNAGVSREEALERVSDLTAREMLAAVDLAEVPVGRAEVAFAWDPRSGKGRELVSSTGHRDYSDLRPGEIAGTVDLLSLDLTRNTALVIDWSTDHDLDVPAKRAQVEVYQLMVARTYGLSQVLGAIGSHRHDGTLAWHRWALDAWDLGEIAARVRSALERIEQTRTVVASGQTPDVSMGSWCRDCKAWLACPGVAQAIRLAQGPGLSVSDKAPDLEQLGTAYDAARLAERWSDHVRELARAQVERAGSLALPGGKRLVQSTDSRGRKSLRVIKA